MVIRWQEADGVHLDLRGMFPPEPMIEILREIDCGAGGPIIVYMDRDPILLYPELEDRGWSARPHTSSGPPELTSPANQAPVTLVLLPEPSRD